MDEARLSKHSIISSLAWKLLERCGTQGIQFIISIVLARFLFPKEYGIVAIISVFIALASVFVQGGLSTALIQKKEVDDLDYSSVFYISLFLALCIYVFLYFMAPAIAGFYSTPLLIPATRVLSLMLFPGAVNSVQVAIVSRLMQFKRFFVSSIGAVVVSGLIGITLAYKGYGVWALVVQQLVNGFVVAAILLFTVKWRPRLKFSFSRVKSLYSYGWKLLVSGLLDTLFKNIYALVIGKVYQKDLLGYFNRGQQFPSVLAANLDGSIQSVLLPVFAANQHDLAVLKQMTRRAIKTSSYLMFPSMFVLAAIARPLVFVLLTDKWLPCVPFMQMACLAYAMYSIHTTNLTAINAMGRSDIFLKLEIIKKIIVVLVLIVTMRYGIYVMAAGQVFVGILATFINTYPNKELLNYSYWEQLNDLSPSLFLGIVMAVCVVLVERLFSGSSMKLMSGIAIGTGVFFIASKMLRLDNYTYLSQTIRGACNGRK